MFKKIVVALDMSPMAEEVFKKALSIAKSDRAELILLHVISSEEDNSPLAIPPNIFDLYPAAGNELTIETWQEEWENYLQEGIKLLTQYNQKAIASDVQAQYFQLQGSSGSTICQFARDHHADLIVIGRRGRTGLSEMFLGSVSNYVLHHAYCSVLIVQQNYPPKSS
jgi:nucleotide-binding universal stress UspA family protein